MAKYFTFTPANDVVFRTATPEQADGVKPGDEYYLDLTPAAAAGAS